MAIATADGRSVVVVCDGVASTANSHLASRAAADAVLAVLEPVLYAPAWPDASGIHDLMDEAFAEAQVAVTGVPDDEPDGNDVSPSTTLVAAIATPELVARGQHRGQPCLLAELRRRATAAVLTSDDSWAQDSIADGVAPDLAYAHPDAHTITRWIGGDADSVVPTLTLLEVTEPGLLVLCSDGLWNYFEDVERLGDLVPRTASSPIKIARQFTDAALDAGGNDNITVAVAPLGVARSEPVPAGNEE